MIIYFLGIKQNHKRDKVTETIRDTVISSSGVINIHCIESRSISTITGNRI